MWPFNRGPSKADLVSANTSLVLSLKEVAESLKREQEEHVFTKQQLHASSCHNDTLASELDRVRGDRHIQETGRRFVESELAEIKSALVGYGYPTNVGALRGKLKCDEELYLALKRKEVADAEEE